MADTFDLQGWMREQKQGPYAGPKGVEKVALKSSKPKSKTGLNEGLMGMIDLQPVGHLSEEFDETYEEGIDDYSDPAVGVVELDVPQNLKLSYLVDAYPQLKNVIKRLVSKDEMDTYEIVEYITGKLKPSDLEKVYNHFEPLEGTFEGQGEEDFVNELRSKLGLQPDPYGKMEEGDDIPENPEDPTSQPGYVHEDDDMEDAPEIEDTWNKPSEFDKDDDEEKMAAMAMKQAKSSKKGMKGITADWTIDDILGGDDDDF